MRGDLGKSPRVCGGEGGLLLLPRAVREDVSGRDGILVPVRAVGPKPDRWTLTQRESMVPMVPMVPLAKRERLERLASRDLRDKVRVLG